MLLATDDHVELTTGFSSLFILSNTLLLVLLFRFWPVTMELAVNTTGLSKGTLPTLAEFVQAKSCYLTHFITLCWSMGAMFYVC